MESFAYILILTLGLEPPLFFAIAFAIPPNRQEHRGEPPGLPSTPPPPPLLFGRRGCFMACSRCLQQDGVRFFRNPERDCNKQPSYFESYCLT